MSVLFVTGIDTGIGKTYATGAIAKSLIQSGKTVFTQKLVETGCGIDGDRKFSQDLLVHQKIIGQTINTEAPKLHAPYLFEFPASPHLSAEMEGRTIETSCLKTAIHQLTEKCDHLIIEGAGGLCVPLSNKLNNISTTADLISELNIPIALVTTPRLGSINHTLLSLDYCLNHQLRVHSIIFNTFKQSSSEPSNIENNTRNTLQTALNSYVSSTKITPSWYELDKLANLSKKFQL